MTYESGETIILRATITKDLAETLDNLTVTISLKKAATGIVLISDAAMTYDGVLSNSTSKVYYYILNLPDNLSGALNWFVTVSTLSNYKTIACSSFDVQSTC